MRGRDFAATTTFWVGDRRKGRLNAPDAPYWLAMSRENVEAARGCIEAYVRGDYDAASAFLAPDVTWEIGQELPARGRAEVREVWKRWDSEWDELETVAEELIDAGEQVVVAVRYRGRGRISGVEVDDLIFELQTFRDGLCVRKVEFKTRAVALEAAGASENVKVVREAYDVLASQGVEAFSRYWADDIEWHAIGGRWQGVDAGRAYLDAWLDLFDPFETEPLEVIDTGDERVVIYLRYSGRAKGSGLEVPPEYFAIVAELRGGRMVRAREYETREQALEAVGMSA
jgi:ketosteroid isomerase-like protein